MKLFAAEVANTFGDFRFEAETFAAFRYGKPPKTRGKTVHCVACQGDTYVPNEGRKWVVAAERVETLDQTDKVSPSS